MDSDADKQVDKQTDKSKCCGSTAQDQVTRVQTTELLLSLIHAFSGGSGQVTAWLHRNLRTARMSCDSCMAYAFFSIVCSNDNMSHCLVLRMNWCMLRWRKDGILVSVGETSFFFYNEHIYWSYGKNVVTSCIVFTLFFFFILNVCFAVSLAWAGHSESRKKND